MSISTHFCDPTLWAQTHFGGTVLSNSPRLHAGQRLGPPARGQHPLCFGRPRVRQ
ncbi:hypothetical protein [Hymenobacter frigidus]|uniref:hypothetical protein n=1 Tax=Hymenobacter frigidus TaxID=1524095 RepID=UPI0016654F8C|nr:hypothetical protein [Hymenobacter frigidus]